MTRVYPPPRVARRREAEFAAATSRAEIDALGEKWLAEDQAADEAASGARRALSVLAARVDALERQLEEQLSLRGLMKDDALVEVLGAVVAQERQRTATEIEKAIAARPVMAYRGIYEGTTKYLAGDVVTHAGGAWTALCPTTGETPGRGAGWRLIAKGDGR